MVKALEKTNTKGSGFSAFCKGVPECESQTSSGEVADLSDYAGKTIHEGESAVFGKFCWPIPSWALQSPISVSVIIELLTICLEDTSFKFRGKFYRMTDGLAMGSPVSPIVANIFMENFERNAILTMKDRPHLWLRFVDDVLAIVKRTSLPSMHLNKQNAAITFTMEVEKDGKLPFLDGEIERENARLNLSVYRKPSHSGRYLNFNSHNPISAKCSTADALFNRAGPGQIRLGNPLLGQTARSRVASSIAG